MSANPSGEHGRLKDTPPRRAAGDLLAGISLALILSTFAVSVALLVYTAYRHDLENGLFAIAFTTLIARTTLVWLRQKEENSTTE